MARQQLNLRVATEEREAWLRAADKAKLDLSSWIRTACNVAANYPREPAAKDQPPAAATCPHPPKERTSYGLCQRCKAVVVP